MILRPGLISSSRSCRIPLGWKRHADVDAGSTMRLRLNRECPIHQPNTFLHTDKTRTWTLHPFFDVKTSARVINHQINYTSVFPQRHFNPFHTTVLRGIVKSFLQDPE